MKRLARIFSYMVLAVIVIGAWLLNAHYFNGVGEQINHCKVTHFEIEGEDQSIVFGAEDMEIDREHGLAFISAYDRARVAKELASGAPISEGGLYVWDINAYPPSGETIKVKDISATLREQIDFRPHGMSMLKTEEGLRFFVVNHAFPILNGNPHHEGQVVLLDYLEGQLQLAEIISASQMCSPNDVAALDANSFLVTNDHGACEEDAKKMEELLGKKQSYLLYWDGSQMRQVASGFAYANGVSIAPNDPSLVFLAATRENKIHIFDRKTLLDEGLHQPSDRYSISFSPDNFTWDEQGDLIVAGFPNLYRYAAYRAGLFGIKVTPAIAVQIKTPRANPQITPLFNDNSGHIRGATVASIINGYTVATSVFDDRILICEPELDAL